MTEIKTTGYYTQGTVAIMPGMEMPAANPRRRFTEENERKRRLARNEQLHKERRYAQVKMAAQANKIKAAEHRKNLLMTIYMGCVVLLIGAMFVGYVSLRNNITTTMKHIASLETQINEIKADNKAAESRIATAVNLNDIKSKAINELGMVYATSDQIVYYSMDNNDYMSQYNDIP